MTPETCLPLRGPARVAGTEPCFHTSHSAVGRRRRAVEHAKGCTRIERVAAKPLLSPLGRSQQPTFSMPRISRPAKGMFHSPPRLSIPILPVETDSVTHHPLPFDDAFERGGAIVRRLSSPVLAKTARPPSPCRGLRRYRDRGGLRDCVSDARMAAFAARC